MGSLRLLSINMFADSTQSNQERTSGKANKARLQFDLNAVTNLSCALAKLINALTEDC